MVYHIMFMDTPVIDIETNEKNIVTHWEKHVPDSPIQPFWGENIDTLRFFHFLKDRCYEDSRADLKDILAAHGMENNNPYEWCMKTHGVTYEDFFWIRYNEEEITWEDVRVR